MPAYKPSSQPDKQKYPFWTNTKRDPSGNFVKLLGFAALGGIVGAAHGIIDGTQGQATYASNLESTLMTFGPAAASMAHMIREPIGWGSTRNKAKESLIATIATGGITFGFTNIAYGTSYYVTRLASAALNN